MRVLKWIFERVKGKVSAIESPVGWMPRYEHINWDGLNLERHDFNQLMDVDREDWKKELLEHDELFNRMYDKLPKELFFIRELLLSSLWRSPEIIANVKI